MDSIIQKYTLYDLFGYFMPGSILLSEFLITHNILLKISQFQDKIHYDIPEVLLVILFLIVAYMLGSLVAMINQCIIDLFHNFAIKKIVFNKIYYSRKLENYLHLNGLFYIFENNDDNNLTAYEQKYQDIIKNIFSKKINLLKLKKEYRYMKIGSNKPEITKSEISFRNDLFKDIYSYIQINKDYERVHVYNASRNMFYNLATVLILILIDLIITNHISIRLFMILLILICLSLKRGRYMYNTMIRYIIKWFYQAAKL